MFNVMDESTHEENLNEPLKINNKQPKIAITFLTGYNEIFSLTGENNKFFYNTPEKVIVDIEIPKGSY